MCCNRFWSHVLFFFYSFCFSSRSCRSRPSPLTTTSRRCCPSGTTCVWIVLRTSGWWCRTPWWPRTSPSTTFWPITTTRRWCCSTEACCPPTTASCGCAASNRPPSPASWRRTRTSSGPSRTWRRTPASIQGWGDRGTVNNSNNLEFSFYRFDFLELILVLMWPAGQLCVVLSSK